jgi:hypothetical protein
LALRESFVSPERPRPEETPRRRLIFRIEQPFGRGFSVGDVVVLIGIAVLIYAGMRLGAAGAGDGGRPHHLHLPPRAPLLRAPLRRPHGRRLPPLPGLHSGLRSPGRLQPAGRAGPDAPAGRPPERAHPLLPPGRPPEPQCHSAGAGRGRIGLHRPHLHQPGLEHDLRLVSVPDDHPERTAGGQRHFPFQRLAPLQGTGTPLCGHQSALEQHDELGRGLVLPDGGGDFHCGTAGLPSPWPGGLLAGGRQSGRYPRHPLGNRHAGAGHRRPGPTGLAALAGLGRPLQIGDGGGGKPAHFLVLRPPAERAHSGTALAGGLATAE